MSFGNRDEGSYLTRLMLLRALPPRQQAQCEALRREAGRCWSALVTLHRERREQGAWLSTRDLELYAANRFALHSQTLQALAQRLDANLQTGRALREQEATKGDVRTQLPYKTPEFQTVTWKDMAIAVDDSGRIQLSNGRGRPALTLPLPPEYQRAEIRRAELLWRADHYELCLTLDTTEVLPEPCAEGATAGVDLGEIHIAGSSRTAASRSLSVGVACAPASACATSGMRSTSACLRGARRVRGAANDCDGDGPRPLPNSFGSSGTSCIKRAARS